MSETKLTIDASGAIAALDAIDRRLTEIEAQFRRIPAATKGAFRADIAGRFEADTRKAAASANALEQELAQVAQKNAAAFNPAQARTYAQAIAGAAKSADGLEAAADQMKGLNNQAGLGSSLFKGLLGAAAGFGAAFSFGEAITAGVQLNAEYERVKTSLTVILKDGAKADKLLGQLNRFAADTPFQTDQINRAANSLLAFGVAADDIIPTLQNIGNISAATGKDFNELTTIYGKARIAGVLYAEDINQLVEAGVPIIQAFADQMKVGESQVKKLASEGKIGFSQLETAFRNMTTSGGQFAGMLEKQSQTLGGILSTIKDLATQKLRQLFTPLADGLKEAGLALVALLDPSGAASRAFADQGRKVSDLEKKLTPLLARYEQLQAKTTPTKNEQAELGKVISEIGRLTPGAITEIDRYGNALAINAEKSRAFLEAEQKRLKYLNKEAIEKVKEDKRLADEEIRILQARIKASKQVETTPQIGGGGLFGGTGAQPREVALTASEIQKLTKRVQELSEVSQGADAQIKSLLGQPIADTTAKPGTGTGTGTGQIGGGPGTSGGGKVKSATEIAFDKRDADLQKRRLLLNDLEEGLQKELEAIRLHFDELRLEYDRANLSTQALTQRQAAAEVKTIADFAAKATAGATLGVEQAKKAGEQAVADLRARIEAEKALRESQIDLTEEGGKQLLLTLQKQGAKENELARLKVAFDKEVQRARLESELQFQEALLSVTDASNTEQADQIRQKIALIRAQLQTLSIELNNLQTQEKGGKKKTIWDLLGIDIATDDGKRAKAAVEEISGQIIDQVRAVSAARVQAAQEAVEAADREVQAAESALDREIELAQAGFANNTTLRRQELEDKKAKQKEALEAQRKAQRTQILLDSALQLSSLITASSNLFKSLSILPFGTGIPIAIALIATMFGAFAKAKSDAIKATKARYGLSGFLGKGGIVHGRSHANGGEILEVEGGEMVQVGDDGTRRRVAVVRRERVAEYFDLLDAANQNDRKRLAAHAFALAGVDQSPRLNAKVVTDRVFQAAPVNVTVHAPGPDARQTNALLAQILRAMNTDRGERWTPDGKVKINGGVRTRYNS